MALADKCSLGLLTPLETPNCLTPLSNEVLCGVELVLGLLVSARLVRELPRVSIAMRIMLSCYTGCLLFVCAMCTLALAKVDERTVIHYVLWTLAHVCYAMGIAMRMHVFVMVVYNASRQKIMFKTSPFSIAIFIIAAVFSLLIVCLWSLSVVYADPGSLLSDRVHRAGFIVWGVFTLIMSTSLFFVSRHVIKLYTGLVHSSDASEVLRRQKAASVLRHMTIATCGAMFFSSINYFVIGSVPGALRNEVAHAQFWLVELAMLPLTRFVRQCGQIRAEASRRESSRGIRDEHSSVSDGRPASISIAGRNGSRTLSVSRKSPTQQPEAIQQSEQFKPTSPGELKTMLVIAVEGTRAQRQAVVESPRLSISHVSHGGGAEPDSDSSSRLSVADGDSIRLSAAFFVEPARSSSNESTVSNDDDRR